jgi:hypothetical protein
VLRVFVGEDGRPVSVSVITDPGMGFAEQATQCAMKHHYLPPIDHNGRRLASATKPFRIHFERGM